MWHTLPSSACSGTSRAAFCVCRGRMLGALGRSVALSRGRSALGWRGACGVRAQAEEERGAYGRLGDADVALFERLLGPSAVLTDPADMEPFNQDWLRTCRGERSLALLRGWWHCGGGTGAPSSGATHRR